MTRWRNGLTALLAAAAPAVAQEPAKPAPQDIAGAWLGKLNTGPVTLRLALKIQRPDGGALQATVDSIDQGAKNLTVDEIAFEDGRLRFVMKKLGASYTGTLAGDGARIEGTFVQAGARLPLVFERSDATAIEPKRPQEPKEPLPYRAEDVTFEVKLAEGSDGAPPASIRLAGTLTLPPGDGPHPAAVLVSGSGPQDRDESLMGHRPFLVLADALTRRGIAVLRYDDRGVGKSTGSFASATTEDFSRDAAGAVAWLGSRPEVDGKRIGIVGHSEGGLIAPVAAVARKDVAFIVLMAGPGVPGRDVVLHQGKLIGRAMGLSEEQVAATAATNAEVFDIVAAGGDETEMRTKLEARLAAAWETLSETQRGGGDMASFVSKQTAAVASRWFRHFLTFDPRPVLAKVTCPVLAINGEKDLQVDPKQNLPEIEKALAKNADVTCLELPGLNHLFQTCTTGAPLEYGVIEETFAPAALSAIADWIWKRFGR